MQKTIYDPKKAEILASELIKLIKTDASLGEEIEVLERMNDSDFRQVMMGCLHGDI